MLILLSRWSHGLDILDAFYLNYDRSILHLLHSLFAKNWFFEKKNLAVQLLVGSWLYLMISKLYPLVIFFCEHILTNTWPVWILGTLDWLQFSFLSCGWRVEGRFISHLPNMVFQNWRHHLSPTYLHFLLLPVFFFLSSRHHQSLTSYLSSHHISQNLHWLYFLNILVISLPSYHPAALNLFIPVLFFCLLPPFAHVVSA